MNLSAKRGKYYPISLAHAQFIRKGMPLKRSSLFVVLVLLLSFLLVTNTHHYCLITIPKGFLSPKFQSLSVEVGNEPVSPPMYLAAGLGIDSFGIGGGELDGDFLSPANFDDGSDAEEYYRKMVDQYPCHPLFLRNYAQVLQVSLLFLIFSLLSQYINVLELHKIRRNYEPLHYYPNFPSL